MNRKIYIAGKITGCPGYTKKFDAAADLVRAFGDIPLNPAVLPQGLTPHDYMRICFAMIDVADGIYYLSDADQSAGALIERAYSLYVGKPTVRYREEDEK